jgi:hypothetical protein
MLVYENYNKFISATDTIRSMRSKVDGMESKMADVKVSIGHIAENNSALDDKMEARRTRFDELNTVRDVMSKLGQVFEIPNKCKMAVERGSLEVAVKYIASSKAFLEAYASEQKRGALAQVKQAMEACQVQLVDVLKEKLKTDPDNNVDVINFLRQLGEPVAELEDTFVSSSRLQLEELMKKAKTNFERCAYVGDLFTSQKETEEGQETETKTEAPYLTDGLTSLVEEFAPCAVKLQSQYKSMFASSSKNAQQEAGKFDSIAEDLIEGAIAAVKKLILNHPQVDQLISPPLLVRVLTRINSHFESLQGTFPKFEIMAMVSNCLECSLRNYVGSKFLDLECRMKDTVKRSLVGKSTLGGMSAHVSQVTEGLRAFADETLKELQDLQLKGNRLIGYWQESYVGLIEEGCYQTLFSFMQEARSLSIDDEDSTLFLSQLLRLIGQDLITHVDQKLSSLFVPRAQLANLQKRTQALVEDFSKLSLSYLEDFVAAKGKTLSKLIRLNMLHKLNWSAYGEQEGGTGEDGVYPVFKEICENLRSVEKVICPLISENGRKMNQNKAREINKDLSTSRVERNVDRLFAEKIQIFGEVQATQAAILSGITKIAIKSLIECIRLSNLNLPAYQLIHTSTVFLRKEITSHILGEDDVVEFLLDEAQSACSDRCCVEPPK